MAVAVALWSILCEPGKKTKFVAEGDIRVTNAALSDKLVDSGEKARTSVKLTYETPRKIADDDDDEDEDDKPPTTTTVLCSLTPWKVEQTTLDFVIEEEGEYEIEVVGKNPVYLSGNYIDQAANMPFPGDDSDFDSDEDSVDLRDVSSDVEIDPAELDIPSDEEGDSHRFEEVASDGEKPKKRPRVSDVMEIDAGDKPSKKNKKKLKGEDGKAVPADAEKPASSTDKTSSKANGETKKKKEKKPKEEAKGSSESPAKEKQSKELAGGLKLTDIKSGTGRVAKKGDTVSMRYIGKFEDGKVFDSNTKGKPFTFRLGEGEVIKGWDEGIAGMAAGGERLLIVPPKLGYGNRKIDGIPAGSTLRFECKLLEIK